MNDKGHATLARIILNMVEKKEEYFVNNEVDYSECA